MSDLPDSLRDLSNASHDLAALSDALLVVPVPRRHESVFRGAVATPLEPARVGGLSGDLSDLEPLRVWGHTEPLPDLDDGEPAGVRAVFVQADRVLGGGRIGSTLEAPSIGAGLWGTTEMRYLFNLDTYRSFDHEAATSLAKAPESPLEFPLIGPLEPAGDEVAVAVVQWTDLPFDLATDLQQQLFPELDTPASEQQDDGGESGSSESDAYVVTVHEDDGEVQFSDERSQRQVMVEVANYLVRNHDLIERVEPLPYVPAKKALLNDEPSYEGASYQYHELDGGYYIDTKYAKAGKRRELRRLAEQCGLDISFGGKW